MHIREYGRIFNIGVVEKLGGGGGGRGVELQKRPGCVCGGEGRRGGGGGGMCKFFIHSSMEFCQCV